MKFKKYLFWLILSLGVVLRLYQLTTLPALNADEAAIGYNAYSLLETGRDEHGNSWPTHFQSFNDYKPGVYFYVVLPFVKLLGLNEWSVRLPGAILGVLAIWGIYLLVRQLFPKRLDLALVSALFLAIFPWHIHFSRGGWEVNAGTTLFTFGIFALLKGLTKHKWLYLSVALLMLSLYTYHSLRVVVPLIVLGLCFVHKKTIFSKSKVFLLPVLVGVLLLLQLTRDLIKPEAVSRAAGVGLFADTGPFWRTNQQRGQHDDLNSIASKAFHNKAVNYGLAFAENYFEHFSGDFLFLSGDDIQRDKVPDTGQGYLLGLLFLIIGLWGIAKIPDVWVPILLWLLIAPVAAALTFQSPHALRAQNMVIPLMIISAHGAISIFNWLKLILQSKQLHITCYVLLIMIFVWDFTRYLHQYYMHMSKEYSFSSQYGVKELVDYISDNQYNFREVVVTDRYDQPYILFLFYMKYSPEKFQKEHVLTERDGFGFSTVRRFGKYTFISTSPWDKIRTEHPNALIAGTDEEIPDAANIQKTVYFPSGKIAFQVVAN